MKDKNNKTIKILEKQMFSENLEAQSPSHYGLNLAWFILMSDIVEFNKSRDTLFINLDIPDV